MSADSAVAPTGVVQDLRALRVYRYAVGTTIAMAVAMGFDWPLAYLTPYLTISFLASPDPCPTLRQGAAFVAVITVAVLAGQTIAKWLLPFPPVFILFAGLALFRLFYAKAGGQSPLLNMWLLIAVTVIPLATMMAPEVSSLVAISITMGTAITIGLVWVTYLLFPDPPGVGEAAAEAVAPARPTLPPPAERFRTAAETTLVVCPVLVLFYTLEFTSASLVLAYIALLSAQPGFAKDFKAGAALIVANAIGGAVAIVFYNLLVLMPEFVFLVLLTLLTGLLLGAQFFSGKKTAPLFGMAFSTMVLVIGSTTSGNAEATAEVYTRIFQIMVAVSYVVVAFGIISAFRRPREV